MSFAHTFGTGGPDVELLLVAVAVLALGIVFFFSKTTKPMVPVVLLLAAFALGAGAFTFGSSQSAGSRSAPDVTVAITDPGNGDTVAAGRPFRLDVEVRGGELTTATQSTDPTKGHLHVFVDGELIAMPTTPTPEIELESGRHEITVEFTGADHRSFSPKIIDRVSVTAEEG
jgi:hypothetical protein